MSDSIRLGTTPPFDWAAMHAYLAARAIPGTDRAGPGFYARSIATGGSTGTVSVRPTGTGDALLATFRFPDPKARGAIAARLRRVFDLDADPDAIRAGFAADPFMAGLFAERPGLRVPGAWDGFELAVRAILGQQVSVAAATKLAGRLVQAFGARLDPPDPEHGLTHLFPTPEALVEADVSLVLNMPRARGAAVRGLAAAVMAEPGLFAMGQGLEAAVARLKALRGVGDWTAHYIAMRALREPDAFPASDIGLLRALETESGRPSAAALIVRAQAWRPWRAYAVVHLWAHDAAQLAARKRLAERRR